MYWPLYLILVLAIIYSVAYFTTQGGSVADKESILIDFDGTIHQYRTPSSGGDIPDPPVLGTRIALQKLRKKYKVIIFSTRARTATGIKAIRRWLYENDIKVDDIVSEKIPTRLIIDDRAIQFKGNWDTIMPKIDTFLPWNRRNK